MNANYDVVIVGAGSAGLTALGRRPNLGNLGLEALDVTLDVHSLPPVDPATLQVAGGMASATPDYDPGKVSRCGTAVQTG